MIPLGPDWGLDTVDSRNWTLLKRFDKKNKEDSEEEESPEDGWKVEGYYPTLGSALRGALNKEITIPEPLAALSARIDAIEDCIDEVLRDYTGRGLYL